MVRQVRHTGRFLAVWLLTLPLALAPETGWLTVLIAPWPWHSSSVLSDMFSVFK